MEIRDVHYFPDGRSIVETIGSKRFRVVSAQQVDGYYIGDIEIVHDEIPSKSSEIEGMFCAAPLARHVACTFKMISVVIWLPINYKGPFFFFFSRKNRQSSFIATHCHQYVSFTRQ
jgi:hypothetical protein